MTPSALQVAIRKHHDPDFEPWWTVVVIAVHGEKGEFTDISPRWESQPLHSRKEAQAMVPKAEKIKALLPWRQA